MKNLFNMLKEIEENEFATVSRFAETDEKNTKFKDYEYFIIEKDNMFFYIQTSTITDNINGVFENYTITAYKKINYNTKQQLSFPTGFNTFEELKNIINKMLIELKYKNPLKYTFKQDVNSELKGIIETKFGKMTIFEYLKRIAGNREKEILKNIDKISMNLNNKNYLVIEFFDDKNNSFAINTKNIERLIIS